MHTLPNLPPSIAHEIFATLCGSLPPPATDTDTQEHRAARQEKAMAAVAALRPADAFEAELAAQIVSATAHAAECFRLAAQPGQDPEASHRTRAQAATMMRLMQSGLRILHRIQATREKAEAALHPAAMERAGYWFRDVSVPAPGEDRAPALGEGPGSLPAPSPAQAEAPQPIVRQPSVAPPGPGHAEPGFTDLTEAEQYATLYPDRAARIRAHRGLPPRLDFGPPEPELVEAIVNGTSPILRALDHHPLAPAAV